MDDDVVTDRDFIQQGGGNGLADAAHVHNGMFFVHYFDNLSRNGKAHEQRPDGKPWLRASVSHRLEWPDFMKFSAI
jgi:hypothetical protein